MQREHHLNNKHGLVTLARGLQERSALYLRHQLRFRRRGNHALLNPPPHCLPDRGTYLTAPLRPVFVQVLYNELDQWREAETKRIKQAECGQRRKLALRELLHKETRLLQTIDRLKITAAHEGKVRAGSTGVD